MTDAMIPSRHNENKKQIKDVGSTSTVHSTKRTTRKTSGLWKTEVRPVEVIRGMND